MSPTGLKNFIPVFVIVCYALSFSRAQDAENNEPIPENLEVCADNECAKIAAAFNASIDSEIQPCDDFYAYACGKIIREATFPDGWDTLNNVNAVVRKMTYRLIESLKKKNPKDPDVVKKAKAFFANCNNEEKLINLGVVPLNILLKNIHLPLLPPYLGALDMPDNFGVIMGKMRQHLFACFPFQTRVGRAPNDKNESRLELVVPELNLNSNIPYRPPPPSTPKPASQTQQENNSRANAGEDQEGKRKTAASARPLSRSTSKNGRKSVSLASRSLETRAIPPGKPKTLSRSNSEDEKKRKQQQAAARKLREKEQDDGTQERDEGSDSDDEETTASLEITEDKNQPLIEYMMKLANYLYKKMNLKLQESKKSLLREKVTETAKIIHEVEKLAVKAREETGENGKEMTIQELEELTNSFDTKTDKKPIIDWTDFIVELLSYHPDIKSGFLENKRTIYIQNINYLKSVLKLFYESNPRAVYCAIWWSVVRPVLPDLYAELRDLETAYQKQAKQPIQTREEQCLTQTLESYGYAAAYDFVNDEATKKNINTATQLFSLFYSQLSSMIQTSSILDTRTIMAANLRADSGNYVFGIPTSVDNDKGLNDAYRNMIFHEDNHFFTRFFQVYEAIRMEMEMLNHPFPQMYLDPLAKNAEYDVQLNSQLVPLVYSQYPFVGNGLASITMGMLAIPYFQQAFHHFDVLANEYNLWGVKEKWWAKKALRNFNAQAKCFIESYSKECFEGIGCVDGERTLHENVADHGALKATIAAYKDLQNIKKEPKLKDFESFSHLRLLTLAFAVAHCQTQTPQKLAEILKTSKYPPPSVRVNQVLKNLPEFARIWGCEKDDKMNPSEKCQVWGYIVESKRKFEEKSPEKKTEIPEKETEIPEKKTEIPEKKTEIPEKKNEIPEKDTEIHTDDLLDDLSEEE